MGFSASPTEVALRNRISELEAKVRWLEGCAGLALRPYGDPPEQVTVSLHDEPPRSITLQRAASLVANINSVGRLTVRAEGEAEGKHFGAEYTESALQLSTAQVADIAAHLHERFVHTLARFIEKNGAI